MAQYDPSKRYTWTPEDTFTLTGAEFGLFLNTVRAYLSSEEAARFQLMSQTNEAIEYLEDVPELKQQFDAHNDSRKKFGAEKKAGKHNEDWQKHYFQGLDVNSGEKTGRDRHAIKLNLTEPTDQRIIPIKLEIVK